MRNEIVDSKEEKFIIDTCSVFGSDWAFETAVKHSEYNNRRWRTVECYKTTEEADKGHQKWVKRITTNKENYL